LLGEGRNLAWVSPIGGGPDPDAGRFVDQPRPSAARIHESVLVAAKIR